MTTLFINRLSKANQFLFGLLLLLVVATVCYTVSGFIGYKVVGFILLITVSLLAMVLDIVPIICTAAISALVWNFFFIPPKFTFHIGNTEDAILFAMYFVVAIVSAVLTFKIRQIEKIAQQQQQKEDTVKLYNTLLNSLSHELRTPIAAIIGATDNLQSGNAKLTPLNRNELVTEIAKASFRLNQQVENLLNMSRLESGFIQPKNDWCDISEVVYDVVQRLEENNVTQKISISINPAIPLFKLDKGMLEQVIYNILNNAAQYTNTNCTIYISAACHADVLEIIIEDNGKGFPPEEIKNVFNKCYRLKNTSTVGTGLGLSIVKGFTEAMGGNVKLQNVETGGAKFVLTIAAETSYLKNLKNE
jgi:two-component system, OmpR family, sensor histidine kinase KdpD